jgi:hypothetical protein
MSENGIIQLVTLILAVIGPAFMLWLKARIEKQGAKTQQAITDLHTEINSKMTELNLKTGEAAGLAGEARGRDQSVAAVDAINIAAAEAVRTIKQAAEDAAKLVVDTANETAKKMKGRRDGSL